MLSENNKTGQEALVIHNKLDMETARFRLVAATDRQVRDLFSATFTALQTKRQSGYSAEALKPYKIGLMEILVEMRVRSLEADHNGNIYHSPIFYAVPKMFTQALKRQVNKLRHMDEGQRDHLCQKTLALAKQNAARFGKTSSDARE